MIRDCLEVYKEIRDKKGISIVLDSYIPADGKYIIVNPEGDPDVIDIKMDKKTRKADTSSLHYRTICKYDYYSKYLNSNKAIDPKKIIQSNNYLSFFIKKESLINGKLTEERIDEYFDILADPYKKYSKPKARQLYQKVEEDLGPVDQQILEQNRAWIKENIFSLACEGKDYLKIFFRSEESLFEKEASRYFIPNLFNNNDYNIEVDGQIYGLPDNNLGMNAKKPYLDNKDRKVTMPYMLSQDEALLQKEFFDLLMNFCMEAKYNIFLKTGEDKEIFAQYNDQFSSGYFSGIFLRIQKGKTEAEIHRQDIISGLAAEIPPFRLKNVLGYKQFNDEKYMSEYTAYTTRGQIQSLLNEIFFNKLLINNYFTPPEDIGNLIKEGYLKTSLLLAREKIFGWLHMGEDNGVWEVLDTASMRLILGSIERGYLQKAVRQYNLRASLCTYLKGEEQMGDTRKEIHDGLFAKIIDKETGAIQTDEEYYYAMGQLIYYFLTKSKSSKKPLSLANPFFNARNEDALKQKLQQFFIKYNYEIELHERRIKNLYAMLSGYKSNGKILKDEMIAGFLSNSMIYEKEQKESEGK